MTPTVVSTPAALAAALKAASAGAVILLAPGRWAPVVITDVRTSGVITLRSQDPTHPAILPELTIRSSEGLDLEGLTLASELETPIDARAFPTPFKVLNSSRINLRDLSVHGVLGGDPRNDVNGPQISDSDHVSVSKSEFQHLHVGLIEYRTNDLTIADNNFHDIRVDGIDNAGSSYVTISGNRFSDFYPVHIGGPGDHPDAIQFWTQNQKDAGHDISITGNSFERGRGLGIQGVFVTDQIGLTYHHVVISGNSISGGMYNGVMVSGCDDLVVRDNTIQPYSDMISWIRIEKCDHTTVNHNHAGDFLFKNNAGLTDSRNEKVFGVRSPHGKPPSDDPRREGAH